MNLDQVFNHFMVASLCALGASRADAVTYSVTRLDDPVPDGCQAGDCSLREAVIAANENLPLPPPFPGLPYDEVVLAAGQHLLSRGPLMVTGPLRVIGQGGAQGSAVFGIGDNDVFDASSIAELRFTQLTIVARGGDAVRSLARTTEFFDVRVSGLEAGGGGVVVDGDDETGVLRIVDSEIASTVGCGATATCDIRDSRVLGFTHGFCVPFGGCGGGGDVYFERVVFDGTLDADEESGADIRSNGLVVIRDSEFRNTSDGLGIRAQPVSAEFTRSLYLDNESPLTHFGGSFAIVDSEFRSNSATGPFAGALRVNSATALCTVRNSTFVGNVGNGPRGGAISVDEGASLSIQNSTLSNNSVTVAAAQAGARGAAIGFAADAEDITTLSLRHVTMVAPTILPAGLSGSVIGGTGEETGLVLDVRNSILRGSCSLDSALTMDSDLGNIESAGNTCFLDTSANQVNVPANALALGSLGNFGGRTTTYRPAPTSVAVDAANAAQSVAIDQRGYRRPTGTGPDVGAVEQSAELFRDGFE